MLVDFWAEWCGPCKQLTPVLEKVVKAAKGKVKLVKMDIDEHPAIPGQMGIQSIPAVIAFVNGQPADGFMGALPESQVTRLHRAHHQGQARRRGAGSARRPPTRRSPRATPRARPSSTRSCSREDPTNVPALAGLARAYVATGALEQAKQTLALVPEAKRNDAAVAAARAALELAEQAKSVGPIGELEQKVAAESARPSGALRSRARAQCGQASARRRSITCSRSSSATANGTTTARASSSSSSSRPGARPTRRRVDGRRKLSSILFS